MFTVTQDVAYHYYAENLQKVTWSTYFNLSYIS